MLNCDQESVRLMSLSPGSIIKEHIDQKLSYMDGDCRIHIPIITENEVIFYFNQQAIRMQVGEAWYGDLGYLIALPTRV